MRGIVLFLSTVAACAPRWTQPEFREEAKARAIETAVIEHACPREQVSVRCDASSTTQIFDGRMVVYEEGGVIGTYVTESPNWEIELAVCGHLRRYAYEAPAFWSGARARVRGVPDLGYGMVEVDRTCGGAYCLGAEPACTNCGREHWWPIDTMPASQLCVGAIDDGSINVEIVDNAVELVLVVDSPRELPRRCGESPLFVVIDGAWFSLCGDGAVHVRPGVHRIPTGIILGVNVDGRSRVVEAFDARADRCRHASPQRTVLKRTAANWRDPSWIDL